MPKTLAFLFEHLFLHKSSVPVSCLFPNIPYHSFYRYFNMTFFLLLLLFVFVYLQYCRTMRDQILESFNHRDFSLMVVGNKYDLVPDTSRQSQVRIHTCIHMYIYKMVRAQNTKHHRKTNRKDFRCAAADMVWCLLCCGHFWACIEVW